MLHMLIIKAQEMLQKEEGQGLVEYALIIVLIAIAIIVALGLVGDQINNVFNNIVSGLSTAN